jgi:hypothetical protein
MFIVVREAQMYQKPCFSSPVIGLLHKCRVGSGYSFVEKDLVDIGWLNAFV